MTEAHKNEIKVNIENEILLYCKDALQWEIYLKRSDLYRIQAEELELLTIEHPMLLPCQYIFSEDKICFQYKLDEEAINFEQLKQKSDIEKLRAMLNLNEIEQMTLFLYFIHPENIIFDRNLLPKLAYRGIPDKMPPYHFSQENNLRQYKCLILTLFNEKLNYLDLYKGNLEREKYNEFSKIIISKKDFVEVKSYLLAEFKALRKKEENEKVMILKKKYKLLQQLGLWQSVAMLCVLMALLYFLCFKLPFQNKMLQADEDFLKKDYSAVIQNLENIRVKKIPFLQKYELAYSFVEGKSLSELQKTNIFNNLSLNSEVFYLDYWIENGRGEFEQALDIAKGLEDPDLILYGLAQKIEHIRNSRSLSGSEKESEIEKLKAEYKKYEDKMLEIIAETSGTTVLEP